MSSTQKQPSDKPHAAPAAAKDDDGYELLLLRIRESFNRVAKGKEPLFRTSAQGLYQLFLSKLPETSRQEYDCRACRHFMKRYGGLVSIERRTGETRPVMWAGEFPPFFAPAVAAVAEAVKAAQVVGVFVTSLHKLGVPQSSTWAHMHVTVPPPRIFDSPTRTAGQEAAEKRQDQALLARAVKKYSLATVQAAVALLEGDELYRAEKVAGPVRWLLRVLTTLGEGSRAGQPGAQANTLWHCAATAPAGYCHVASSTAGTLLDDLAAGLKEDAVKRRFAEKMRPTQYQRPSAAPGEQNVKRAEDIVAQLGLETALQRRFARLDELSPLWVPDSPRAEEKREGSTEGKEAAKGGVFAGVKTKQDLEKEAKGAGAGAASGGGASGVSGGDAPTPHTSPSAPLAITWAKFRETVLSKAKTIQYWVPYDRRNYGAIVTAVDPTAPPLFYYDLPEKRYPFSQYVYRDISTPQDWTLQPETWVKVTAVLLSPGTEADPHGRQGKAVYFLLEGCKDKRYATAGSCVFPECLREELREVRKTIEAYSRKDTLKGWEEASACGFKLEKEHPNQSCFKVISDSGTVYYNINQYE